MSSPTTKPQFEQLNDEYLWFYISGSTGSAVADASFKITEYQYPESSKMQGMKIYTMVDRINNFVELTNNWDSYNAEPISQTAITIALQVLDELNKNNLFSNRITINVFPMRDGGVQFEFDAEHSSAELEINPRGDMTFISFEGDGTIWDTMPIHLYELSELKEQLEEVLYA